MFFNGNNDNPHVIKEEDLESNPHNDSAAVDNADANGGGEKVRTRSGGYVSGGQSLEETFDERGEEDVYNSVPTGKKKLSGRDFFGFFKLPLIIIVFIIAAGIVFKYMFAGKPHAAVKKTVKNNTVIVDKKRFSPSVFDYNAKPESKNYNGKGGAKKTGKFNIKFKKEAGELKHNVKFNSGGNYGSAAPAPPQITKKTVVFIEASYGKYILDSERGIKSVKPAGNANELSEANEVKSDAPAVAAAGASAIAVPQGTVIDAYTKYKIFSYNTSVPVIAVAVSGYYYDGKTVFKKGDKFFGTVSVKHSLNRLNINFDKIIERSGHSLTIDAEAMMPDGSGGVKGNLHRHYAGNIFASLAQGIVGAASIFAGGGSGVNSSQPYTFQNQVRENVAQNELNSAQNGLNNYAESEKNISITLPAGTPIKIIFLKPVYVNGIKPD